MHHLPDIVLIVFDTARRDRFGCYGYGRPTTPRVDTLAREGLQLQTMISNAPWTMPSHGSLFTGLYPSEHGCQWQTGPALRKSVQVTLAEWMRDIGYETVCATNNGLISTKTGLARGFDHYAFRLDLERGGARVARRLRKALFGGDSGGATVNRWLSGLLPKVQKPLFLFVNYTECHWSYVPRPRFRRQVGGPHFGVLEGLRYRLRVAGRVGPWEAIARADPRTLTIYDALHAAEHRNADGHLSELIDILRSAGHLRQGHVIMIVTSDHGEHIGEHGLADHHASVDDHLIRVPFVAWGPGLIRQGVDERLYEFVDVFPSLVHLLGGPTPAPYLANRRTDIFVSAVERRAEEYAFAEWRAWTDRELHRLARCNPSYDFSGLRRDLVCVTDGRFKLVRSGEGTPALYDVTTDPDEETDIASGEPDRVRRLRTKLEEAIEAWATWDGDAASIPESERLEIEERLSALGYI